MVFRSISLPASLIEDLKLLKESFEVIWYDKKERATYEKIFERLLSKSGLGHVDPDVYEEFVKAKETRKEFPTVVTRATRSAVLDIYKRMQATTHSSVVEDALKEIATAEEHLAEDLASAVVTPTPAGDLEQSPGPEVPEKKTEKRFVHPDGRWYRAEMGSTTWVPVDSKTGRWFSRRQLPDGYVLKDVEI